MSMIYDATYMIQHYVLYGDKDNVILSTIKTIESQINGFQMNEK